MNHNAPGMAGWKKILIGVLILADSALLVVGAITIPPHFKGNEGSKALSVFSKKDFSEDTVDSEQKEESINLSTKERPELEDFMWYTESVVYDGVPADAEAITKIETATGGWKALIIYDPDDTHDSCAMEFLNMDISGAADSVSLTLDWYLIYWLEEGESFDETGMEDTVFKGKWEKGSLLASGAGSIMLTNFYTLNDKQYAIGTMDTPDGIPAYVALVRP